MGRLRRIVLCGIPVVLFMIALVVLLWMVDHISQSQPGERVSEGSGVVSAPDAAQEWGLSEVGADDRVAEAARDAREAEARSSSCSSFLEDLDEDARHGSASSVDAVTWTEQSGLVDAATGVLERYRDMPGVSLEAAGYLDLHGNAWGALLSDDASWVDVVTVSAQVDDACSEVRVARMRAGGEDG